MSDGNKITILYLIDRLRGFGGTEKHLFQLIKKLDRKKFATIVCPLRFDADFLKIFEEEGAKVICLPLKRIYGISGIKQAAKLYQIIKKYKVDIVQSFNVDSDIYGTIIAKLAGASVMISSRRDLGTYRKNRQLRVLELTNRYVSHFLAVCDEVALVTAETENVPREAITTIYNGIEKENLAKVDPSKSAILRKKFNIRPNDFVVGNVSHFRPEKGHGVFFDAIRQLRAQIPNLRVILVGDGPLRPGFQRDIENEGLASRVFFAGYVTDVVNYLALMDVCCLTPVSNEGFSNALLEQMALGMPVIATDIGGNREAIEHGISGLVVPPNDAKALADAMKELYCDVEKRKAMGIHARDRVLANFTIENMIRRMEDFYINAMKLYGNGYKAEVAKSSQVS